MTNDGKRWFRALLKGKAEDPAEGKPSPLPSVELYTRPACSLCDEAKKILVRVRKEIPFSFREVDVSGDPELERRYGGEVPVVMIGGRKVFKYRVDERRLRKSLRSRISQA